jgi:hypothetical protein
VRGDGAEVKALLLVASALALVMAGCLGPHSIACSDGRFCPAGSECDNVGQTCISAAEKAACANQAEGGSCTLSMAPGVCVGGVCLPYHCGDRVRTGTESCDGDDLGTASCATLGYYGATTGLACTKDCTFDTTGCVGACGDQTKNGPELCDGSDLGGADCTTAGFYDGPGLQCSPFCTFDVSACTGFCGDAKLNGSELCDGSPPTGQTCPGYGFDRGFLGCSAGCGAGFDGCGQLGWKLLASQSELALAAVWGSGRHDVFGVGRSGTIRHWDGASWTAMPSPTAHDLHGVWGSASDDVFAVGSAGTILHWDGRSWSVMTSPVTQALTGVWGSGADAVFAVGGLAVDGGGRGVILHWDGSTWSTMTAPATDDLHAVWGSGPDDVYAVGWTTSVLHWDGHVWSAMQSPNYALFNSVWGSGPDDVYAVGFTIVAHWDGTSWSTQRQPPGLNFPWFLGVWGSGPDDVYAYGGDNTTSNPGRIIHWNGSKWSLSATNLPYDAPTTDRSVGGLWGSGADDVFAVGPPAVIFHGNGTVWTTTTTHADLGITGAWGSDADHVYAVGDEWVSNSDGTNADVGAVLSFGGNSWASVASDATQSLGGITGSVIAGNGNVVQIDSTGLLSHIAGLDIVGLDAWESGPADVFIVGRYAGYGDDPEITHWDGDKWSSAFPTLSGVYYGLVGVWGSGPTDVFAVGARGTILHWNGVAWKQHSSGSTHDLNDVWGTGPNDVFAVGGAGTILHFDGRSWSPIASGTTEDLWGIGGSGSGDVFVTSTYEILHRRSGTWESIALPMAAEFRTLWVTPSRVFLFGTKGEIARLDRYTVTCVGPERDCKDGWDNDCDGLADADDPDCAGKVAEQCANGLDDDGDGLTDCSDPDCNTFPSCKPR